MNNRSSSFRFGSKADTLSQLFSQQLNCLVPKFSCFTNQEWKNGQKIQLKMIAKHFPGKQIAVRSSALCEDGLGNSHAGEFTSILNIDPADEQELCHAIDRVFASYSKLCPEDQVIIQEMVQDIEVSGVILTRCVDDGSPYYVLNYDDESGNTDSITGGKGVHKTVLVYRKYKPEYCDSERVRKMLDLAVEMESVCGQVPLDIEFALNKNGAMHLLQVRRISTVRDWHPDAEHRVNQIIPHVERFIQDLSTRRHGLFGDYTIFGNMPDWNPAELIGVIPSPLSASLFRHLISSHAWSEARARMGYRRLPKTELMVKIRSRVFIDVRASFNSFLPQGIPDSIGEKLINAWLARLSEKPALHDKVEFAVAHTVLDFAFDDNFHERYPGLLDSNEVATFRDLLRGFTNQALDISCKGSLSQALGLIGHLEALQTRDALHFSSDSPPSLAAHISTLVGDCLQYGTIPFTIIARHAFIAEAMLRSAVFKGAISRERIEQFKGSFHTVMGKLSEDTQAVCSGAMSENEFMIRYGHLRPGTFDILSPCYRDRTDLFSSCPGQSISEAKQSFKLSSAENEHITTLLFESGIHSVTARRLFKYAKTAIQGREFAKFIFTRNLSAALEAIARWGEHFGLGREDLSYLSINDIVDTCYASPRGESTSMLMYKVDQARMENSLSGVFKLSYLVRGVRDVHVVPVHRSEPNFITSKKIEAPTIFLKATSMDYSALANRIVCIENADPGFDWIFTKGLAGLITKYGGANSHMAIRCAELHLPAAIGCGEDLFEKVKKAKIINMNCSDGTIRNVGMYEQA